MYVCMYQIDIYCILMQEMDCYSADSAPREGASAKDALHARVISVLQISEVA